MFHQSERRSPHARRRAVIAAVAMLTIFAGTPAAAAQPSEHDQAVELFRRGVAAAREEQWVAARRAFERAYELLPRPEILINLAAAQAQTDQLVEAQRGYREILATDGVDPRLREEAERALLDLDRETPRVHVTIGGLAPGDRVALDDATVTTASLEGDLSVDPGPHTVIVTHGDTLLTRAEFTAERGRTIAVPMTITSRPAGDTEVSAPLAAAPRPDPTLQIALGSILTAAGVGLGVVDLVSLGLEGSCAEGPSGACTEVWALEAGPLIGYAVGGLVSLATGIGLLVWGATMGGSGESAPGAVSLRGRDLVFAF